TAPRSRPSTARAPGRGETWRGSPSPRRPPYGTAARSGRPVGTRTPGDEGSPPAWRSTTSSGRGPQEPFGDPVSGDQVPVSLPLDDDIGLAVGDEDDRRARETVVVARHRKV